MKRNLLLFISTLILVFYFISPSLNPLDPAMFNFHDETQLGRITAFTSDLKMGHIPPRLAPEFSFNLGFPVFNFYAPFSYWITGIFNLITNAPIFSLKFSFFLTIVLSFAAMYLFLRLFFGFYASLIGACLYVTSTYFATEIVIRGNLAESWYLALLPLSLFLLTKNARSSSGFIFIATTLVLSFLFTVHNLFSLISPALIIIYLLLLPNKKKSLLVLVLALSIASYFLLPAVSETKFTHAVSETKLYNYKDHFLCPWQLWTAKGWHFGASVPGCDDDQMSFKVGKPQIIFAFLGLMLFIWHILRKKQIPHFKTILLIIVLTLGSLFLTLYQSQFIWDKFSFFLSLFQFPWRFLLIAIFGLAFFGAYFFHHLKLPFKPVLIMTIIVFSFITARKYFIKPLYNPAEYNQKYNSQEYKEKKIAYMMREYLTVKADVNYWWTFSPDFDYHLPVQTKEKFNLVKNTPFEKIVKIEKPSVLKLNIHYFPFWKIFVNGQQIFPEEFDKLGRPVLEIAEPSTIKIVYKQTAIEQMGNIISVLSIIVLLILPKTLIQAREKPASSSRKTHRS